MTTAVITFSPQGLKVMQRIAAHMAVDQYLHQAIAAPPGVTSFERVVALTGEIFSRYDGLVYVAPCGVVVRAIAPLVDSKLRDPAVVCLDVGARHAVFVVQTPYIFDARICHFFRIVREFHRRNHAVFISRRIVPRGQLVHAGKG